MSVNTAIFSTLNGLPSFVTNTGNLTRKHWQNYESSETVSTTSSKDQTHFLKHDCPLF